MKQIQNRLIMFMLFSSMIGAAAVVLSCAALVGIGKLNARMDQEGGVIRYLIQRPETIKVSPRFEVRQGLPGWEVTQK